MSKFPTDGAVALIGAISTPILDDFNREQFVIVTEFLEFCATTSCDGRH